MTNLSPETWIPAAFGLAFAVALLATPPMRRLAIRTEFLDHPGGYKKHSESTPYLGGAAVMAGFMVGVLALGDELLRLAPVIGCALTLFVVGTIDDRIRLGLYIRLAIQVAAALLLWATGLGWELGAAGVDFALTIVWVVGITNAFNLMDNLDGAAGGIGTVSAGTAGVLALTQGDESLAVLGVALAGACAGFLPHNLARPSRIFLGDGGSMPVGFVVAAIVMASPHGALGWEALLASVPLAGLVIFDTTLVVVSRVRRRVTVLSGGRDHVTHRLYDRLRSARGVTLILALTQGALSSLALFLHDVGQQEILAAATIYLTVGIVGLALFESPLWGGRAAEERA
jgi:UDP-GlcNAc:undecaprenyl-phosphate/decaprenyl-phosphate GlcNAc-1-phosphate transferase